MILFKACPRCGGDVDTTYQDDSYCVQCAYRPTMLFPGPRLTIQKSETSESGHLGPEDQRQPKPGPLFASTGDASSHREPCPKCGEAEVVRLGKVRPQDNTCYQCRLCGYIFSPRVLDRRVRT